MGANRDAIWIDLHVDPEPESVARFLKDAYTSRTGEPAKRWQRGKLASRFADRSLRFLSDDGWPGDDRLLGAELAAIYSYADHATWRRASEISSIIEAHDSWWKRLESRFTDNSGVEEGERQLQTYIIVSASGEHPALDREHCLKGCESLQKDVVGRVLMALESDLNEVRFHNSPPRFARLGRLMTSLINLIHRPQQRRQLIHHLQILVDEAPDEYGDPFIEDMLITSHKFGSFLGLENLPYDL